jgi:hypothetical protein
MSSRQGAGVREITKAGGYVHHSGKESFGKVSDALKDHDASHYLQVKKPFPVWVSKCLQFILLLLDSFSLSTIAILLTVASLLSLDAAGML